MDRTDHAANLIGNYLLKGWVLMDAVCPNPSCSVPLMRSKDKTIQFCVICDDPEKKQTQKSVSDAQQSIPQSEGNASNKIDQEEAGKRRAQSQAASKLIGEKLLQGWAMLEDICPNESCYGVPLIRHKQDKHLYCVICQRNYIREQDLDLEKEQSTHNMKSTDSDKIAHPETKAQTSDSIVNEQNPVVQPAMETQSQDNDSIMDISGCNSAMIVTLQGKMEQLRQNLEGSNDPRLIKEICDAISSCSNAIKHVRA